MASTPSVIIHDLYVFGACERPPKADTELLVHADTVLPGAVAFEGFEPVARRDAEVFEMAGDLQLPKLESRDRLDVHEALDAPAVRKCLRVTTPER